MWGARGRANRDQVEGVRGRKGAKRVIFLFFTLGQLRAPKEVKRWGWRRGRARKGCGGGCWGLGLRVERCWRAQGCLGWATWEDVKTTY